MAGYGLIDFHITFQNVAIDVFQKFAILGTMCMGRLKIGTVSFFLIYLVDFKFFTNFLKVESLVLHLVVSGPLLTVKVSLTFLMMEELII